MGMGGGGVTRGKLASEMEAGKKMKGKKAMASGKKKATKPASKPPWMK